jgi:hypothetical protein
MQRTLKRGRSFRDSVNTMHTRTSVAKKIGKESLPPGTVLSTIGERTTAGHPAEFDISEAEFAKDPTVWEPTADEKAKILAEKAAAEAEWFRKRGKELPEKERELLVKEGALAPENKEIPGTEAEAKRGPGRPRVTVKG